MALKRVGLVVVLVGIIILGNGGVPAQAACLGGAGLAICTNPQAVSNLHYARSEAGHVYGAIAYSKKNGAFGWSNGFGDSDGADDLALENCSKRGPGCYVVISFSNLCASVSADDDGGVFWGTAGTRQEAQRQSQLYCNRDGSTNCGVKAWACSIP